MLEDAITNDGLLKPEILNKLYDEALELSNSIVAYLGAIKKSLKGIGADLMGFYTLECKRIISGVMQAMSWCLMQKGVGNGDANIIRVDRLLFEGGVLEENPVLNLINKIENNS